MARADKTFALRAVHPEVRVIARPPYLTRDELKALAGTRLLSGVIAVLRRDKWKFTTGRDDWPRVLREYFERRMLIDGADVTTASPDPEPAWGTTKGTSRDCSQKTPTEARPAAARRSAAEGGRIIRLSVPSP
jgi:hypothetical protein